MSGATYPIRIVVNDGGPNGLVAYTTQAFVAGVGQITGPTEFEGGSDQTFALNMLSQSGANFQGTVNCGSGTQTAWDNTNFTCAFPEVATATASAVSVTGTLDGQAFTRSHAINVLPLPIVPDATPPTLSVPADMTLDSTSNAGAVVFFLTDVTDAVSSLAEITVSCSHASGSVFPIGTTRVTCTATDAASNAASGWFSVTVRSAAQQILALAAQIDGMSGNATVKRAR